MKSVFEADDNALENVVGSSHEVWVKLGEHLDRRPECLQSLEELHPATPHQVQCRGP